LVILTEGQTSELDREQISGPTFPFLENQTFKTAAWIIYIIYRFRTSAM